MLVDEILRAPACARRYMERYVNNGSPSGFTQLYNCSPETSPLGDTPAFELFAAEFPDDVIENLGASPSWLAPIAVPLHPDMANDVLIAANSARMSKTAFSVTPTASGRTVELLEPPGFGYIKLNYRGMLGRINRQITRAHAISAVEVTTILRRATAEATLPPQFAYYPESSARVAALTNPDGGVYEWGTVFREAAEEPPGNKAVFVVPAFSLFGTDRRRPSDRLLLHQLIERSSISAADYVFEGIVAPLLRSYFSLILNYALQFECHAQNVLVGFNDAFYPTSVIVRDFESVDKNVSLAEDLHLDVTFGSAPYKCLYRDQYNYSIQHSFMYDFKMGHYLLTPLIACVESAEDRTAIVARTKELARSFIARLPENFFPADGKEYRYDSVVHDRSKPRPYFGLPNPSYR